MNIQTDVLDITLPALFTYFIYKLMNNKKMDTHKDHFLVIGIASLGTFCGIFKT